MRVAVPKFMCLLVSDKSSRLSAFDNSGRCSKVLWRPSVRGHRPEIMFGVLVVVFCPDCVSG